MRGYKAFDKNLKCRDFQFEVGKEYSHKGTIKLCEKGFHFCVKLQDVFNYYIWSSETRVCEVEAFGEIQSEGDKSCSTGIRIIREIPRAELLTMMNTGKDNTGRSNSGNYNSGHRNSGYGNSGHRNSGYGNSGNYNSGNYNSGNYNSGHSNSGQYNSGDYNSGFFNTVTPKVMIFNKETDVARENINIPYVDLPVTKWILPSNMTEQEKKDHPNHDIMDGYLKKIEYK